MLLVVTVSLEVTAGPGPRRTQAARRTIATLARLARVHELVVVADWPEHGRSARALVDALTGALPWHDVVLVAARADRRGRRPGSVCNLHTVRRLLDDGSLVVCLAGGPGPDRTGPVAAALTAALPADRMVRLTDGRTSPSGLLNALGDRSGGGVLAAAGPGAADRVGAAPDAAVRTGTPAAPLGW
jgi:hypothetical protein